MSTGGKLSPAAHGQARQGEGDESRISVKELAKHNGAGGSYWTAIDGEVYDVSAFVASHPGGDIIRLAAGRDSSTLIECYHPANKMKSVTSALSTRTKHLGKLEESAIVRNDHSFYLKVQQRVEAQLAAAGIPRHWSDFLSIAEVIITVSLYMIATYYTSVHGSYLASVALGLLTARLGFIMHSGNHMATSDAGWGNVLAGYCMELAGSSHLVWYFEHQVAHHMDPNEVGKDNDCSIGSPHLRFHPDVPAGKSKVTKYQHILTFVAMSGGFLKWYVADFMNFYTGKVGSVDFYVSPADWVRLCFFKGLWFFTHVIVCWYYQGLGWALASPVIFMVIGAHYLENIFIVNHIQEELAHPEPTSHWAVKQVTATANWASGSVFWNWVSGGLNHQIEHHLFPSVSIYNYPLISSTVRQTCAEFGLPYQNYKNFAQAWIAMATYLRDLGLEGGEEAAKAKYHATQKRIDATATPAAARKSRKDN